MPKWTARDIPSQGGRVAVVTGANSGLGLVTARELARAGAHVVMGCRDTSRGEAARTALIEQVPDADVELRRLDLASLASVREFADRMHADTPALDLLVNNAGVMAIPRQVTSDGFEQQFGTNHLGHFALTGLLLPLMRDVQGSRVVTVSSTAHKPGRIDFDDLMGERSYRKWPASTTSRSWPTFSSPTSCNVAALPQASRPSVSRRTRATPRPTFSTSDRGWKAAASVHW